MATDGPDTSASAPANDNHQAPTPLEAQLTAGWDALDHHDLDAAELALTQSTKLCAAAPAEGGPAPEELDQARSVVETLRGALLAQRGQTAEALTAYSEAARLDAAAVEPRLLAAELLALEGKWPEALAQAEAAVDAAEEEEDFLDALLLKAEIELATDDSGAAKETLAEIPPVDLPTALHHERAAECLLEVDKPDEAERHFEAATRLDPSSAEAWYGLGLVAAARGDDEARKTHMLKAAALDRGVERPDWASETGPQFQARVEAAIAAHEELAPLRGRTVRIAHFPDDPQISAGVDPRSAAIVDGEGDEAEIIVFQRNVERMAADADELDDALVGALEMESALL